MKNYVEGSLKRYLKRKVKITLGLVISFLITGFVSYSADEAIKVTTDQNGKITISEEVGKLEDNIWTIEEREKVDKTGSVGINFDSKINSPDFVFKNNGKIIFVGEKLGNAVEIGATIGKVINSGLISGETSDSASLGNGLLNEGKIEILENYGTIKGNYNTTESTDGENYKGNGIVLSYQGTIDKLFNYGEISGKAMEGTQSGNGIIFHGGKIGEVYNKGKIKGEFITAPDKTIKDTSGNGIVIFEGSTMKKFSNEGYIKGQASGKNNSGNGIESSREVLNIENRGKIFGYDANNKDSASGFGIFFKDGEIKNAGYIKGKGTGSGSGFGIFIKGEAENNKVTNTGTIEGNNEEKDMKMSGAGLAIANSKNSYLYNNGKIIGGSNSNVVEASNSPESGAIIIFDIESTGKNLGLIKGKEYGVYVASQNGTNQASFTGENLGIIGGEKGATGVWKGREEKEKIDIKNYGLLINGDKIEMDAQYSDVTIDEVEYRVINAAKKDGNTVTADKILSSIAGSNIGEKNQEMNSDGIWYKNVVINTVGNDKDSAFVIDTTIKLKDSMINGYNNAVIFDENSNSELRGINLTINATKDAIVGTEKREDLWLTDCTINGNIELYNNVLQEGADRGDQVYLKGTVVNGDLNIGERGIAVLLSNGEKNAIVNGNIKMKDGNIALADNTTLNGSLKFEGTKAYASVGRNLTFNSDEVIVSTTDEVKDKKLYILYNVNTEDELRDFRKEIDIFRSFDIYLKTGGNSNVDLRDMPSYHPTNAPMVYGAEGDDTFIINKRESVVQIKDAYDSDNDTLQLAFNINKLDKLTGGYEGIETIKLKDDGVNSISFDVSDIEKNIPFKNIIGGKDEDTLIFNAGEMTLSIGEDELKANTLSNKLIKDIENIEVKTDLIFDHDLKIEGGKVLSIDDGKTLGINLDYSKKDSEGKIIGHALYNNGIQITQTNGNIMFDVSEFNTKSIISLGSGKTATKISLGDTNILPSSSINHELYYDNFLDDILVKVKDEITVEADPEPDPEPTPTPDTAIKYSKLDAIYKSLVSAGKIGLMSPTANLNDKSEDEAIKAQLEFFGKIYNATPYAYSNDISRETANAINTSILDTRFMAKKDEWIHYGAILGRGYDDDNSYHGKGMYNGIDIGTSHVDIESDIYGAYYMGEYGKYDNASLGIVVAGTKSSTDIDESKLKGDGIYLGAYAKYQKGNLRLTSGVGIEHNYYEADRKVSNAYQETKINKKYEDDTLSAYVGARYVYNVDESVKLEPFANLKLSYVMQDDVKEHSNDLAISVEDKNFTAIEGEVGIDIVKETMLEKGKLSYIAGIGAEIILDGYESENLKAKFTGSDTSFNIVSEKEDRVRGKVSLGAEYEEITGIFYNAKASYIKTKDNDDYRFGVGIGYRF